MSTSNALPPTVRHLIYRPLGAIAASAMRRRGEHAIAAPLRVMALHAQGDDAGALAVAETVARRGSARSAIPLARIVLAIGDPAFAQRLLDAHADDSEAVATTALRAEVALALGEYSAAVRLATVALDARPEAPGPRRVADRARGELALLDPAWRPDIRPLRVAPVSGRVLHLLTNSLPHRHAGYTVRAQSVARSQQDVGLDPRMVTRAGFPGNEGVLRGDALDVVDGITYHRVRPDLPPGTPVDRIAQTTADGLIRLVADLRPALLQPTTNYVNGQVALAVGEPTGLPVVYEVRGFLEETWLSRMGEAAAQGERYIAQRAAETAVMRRAAAIVTLSETMRADILERDGFDPDRVVVIPNGVDIERFTPGPRDERLAAALGFEPGEVVIGCISSFTSYEGLGYLIEAVAMLRRRGRRVRLLLVGDGDVKADLEALAGRCGLRRDGTVVFTGRVPHADVVGYHRAIDLFVVPRTNDRVSRLVTPLKPYEAMALERAVVVSGVPALLEIVRDGVTGRTFAPEDATALADVLDALIDDPAQRRRLGEAARTWVVENRTWAQNGQRYLELYRRLGVATGIG